MFKGTATGLDTQRKLTPAPKQRPLMCALKDARILLTVAAAFMFLYITINVTGGLWQNSDSATGEQHNSDSATGQRQNSDSSTRERQDSDSATGQRQK